MEFWKKKIWKKNHDNEIVWQSENRQKAKKSGKKGKENQIHCSLQMTDKIFACQLGINCAMWLVDGHKHFVILTGHHALEGFCIKIEIMFIGHGCRYDWNLWYSIEYFFLCQVQGILYRGRRSAHIGIAGKLINDDIFNCMPVLTEFNILNGRIFPAAINNRTEDAIILIGQWTELIINKINKRWLGSLQYA